MWVEGLIQGVPYYSPSEYPPVVFENSINSDVGSGVWKEATIPSDIPEDVVAVSVVGILIITYGQTDLSETADLHLRLRRPLGATNAYLPDYIGQICESRSGGVRSPFSSWVAVADRKFEYHWTKTTPPPYPEHASYGFKLYVDSYLRQGIK